MKFVNVSWLVFYLLVLILAITNSAKFTMISSLYSMDQNKMVIDPANQIACFTVAQQSFCFLQCDQNYNCGTVNYFDSNNYCCLYSNVNDSSLIIDNAGSVVSQRTPITLPITTAATTSTSPVNTNGLINYWPIINDVKDHVGMADMTCYSKTSLVPDRKNNINSSLLLTNGYCSVPNNIYFYGGAFSVLMWLNLQGITSNTVILDFGRGSAGDSIAFFLPLGGTQGQIQLDVLKGNSDTYVNSVTSLNLNTWYHLAFIYNVTTQSIYINGVLDASNAPTLTPNNLNRTACNFGKTTYSSQYINAILDEIKLYNVALSQSDIVADYLA